MHIYIFIPVGTHFSEDGSEIRTQRWELRWRGDSNKGLKSDRKLYLGYYPGILHWTALKRLDTGALGPSVFNPDPLAQITDKKRAQWPHHVGGIPEPMPRVPTEARGDGHEPDIYPYTGGRYHQRVLGPSGQIVWGLLVLEGTPTSEEASGKGKGKVVTFHDSVMTDAEAPAGYVFPKGPRHSQRIPRARSKSPSPTPEPKPRITAKKTGTSVRPGSSKVTESSDKSPSPTSRLLERRPRPKTVKPKPVGKVHEMGRHLPRPPISIPTGPSSRVARAVARAKAMGKDPTVLAADALDKFNDKSKL